MNFSADRRPQPLYDQEYFQNGNLIVEIRPHGGQLHPFVVLVPNADREKLINIATTGPSGRPTEAALVLGKAQIEAEGKYGGFQIKNAVTPLVSAYVTFSASPIEFVFSQRGSELKQVKPRSKN